MKVVLKQIVYLILISVSTLSFANDSDTDGVDDSVDNCFAAANADQVDTDFDGIGNACDADDDDDGVSDSSDLWPLDYRYSLDSDSGGLPDAFEDANGLNKYVASDEGSDSDQDGLTALQEFDYGTSPQSNDTDMDTLPDGWEIENGRDATKPDYTVATTDTGYSSCANTDTGLRCWGLMAPYSPDGVYAAELALGSGHGCYLTTSSEVDCWGSSLHGQQDVPTTLQDPSMIAAGTDHTCALDNERVECWGRNQYNQTSVPTLNKPSKVFAGRNSSCALTADGMVCWGQAVFPGMEFPDDMTEIAIGWDSGCAVTAGTGSGNFSFVSFNNGQRTAGSRTGQVICWGDVQPPSMESPANITVGYRQACALDGGAVNCWGQRHSWATTGPTGLNLTDTVIISAGFLHVCSLSISGVQCWGANSFGESDVPTLAIDPDGDGNHNQWGGDVFPFDSTEWLDTDSDSIGNNADLDDDGDSVLDIDDTFPQDASESADFDGDGVGDNADAFPNDALETTDSDLDFVGDNSDNCVSIANTDQINSDDDLLGDACDTDSDNDGIDDEFDALPLDSSEQLDTDADGIGNNADEDDDNDGVTDNSDAYPLNVLYSTDSDGDGMADAWESLYGLDPNDPADASSDTDNDGAVALQEFFEGTIPAGSLDLDGNGQYDALTDGLLLLRSMFGVTEDALISGAVASEGVYTSPDDIAARIDILGDLVDIDGNGRVDALTDGVIILRYLFGLRGEVLINGVIASDATITTADGVSAKVESLMPALER
jgi:hypothetical protein